MVRGVAPVTAANANGAETKPSTADLVRGVLAASAPPPGPDPFAAELAKALIDVRAVQGVEGIGKARPPMLLDAADLMSAPREATPWLIRNLVTRDSVVVIGAAPKACKTWIATEMALAIAVGGMAFGQFRAEAGTVAYFYAEDTAPEVRITALGRGCGATLSPRRMFVQPRRHGIDLTLEDDLAWVLASCRRCGQLDALFLDPLRDLHTAEENDAGDMAKVMGALRVLAGLLKCTVFVAHHVGKPQQGGDTRRAGQRLRGSSAIGGALDAGIYINRVSEDDPAQFELVVDTELRSARAAGSFSLRLTVEDDDQGRAERATWHLSWEMPLRGKAAKDADKAVDPATLQRLEREILAMLEGSDTPLSRKDLEQNVTGRAGTIRVALEGLQGESPPRVVSVKPQNGKSLSTPARAREIGFQAVTGGAV